MSLSSVDKNLPIFTFKFVKDHFFSFLEDKEIQEDLMKWGMKDNIAAQLFIFDQPFQCYQYETLLNNFMNDPVVFCNLKIRTLNSWTTLGQNANSISCDVVPCTVKSLEFFDRLEKNGIVHENGHLSKCFDEYYEDFIISDELRKMFLLEDSENYELYSKSEKEEFLFRILKHVCLGGKLCQYEDEIKPYFNSAKKLYRDLVSVIKDPETKELQIASCIYKIIAYDKDGVMIYPSDESHEQTFAYLFVDPFKKQIKVLYHCFA